MADRTAVVPGEPMRLVAKFAIPQGSHIYWSNPGESGLATTAHFSAPPAITVSEVSYPAPDRFSAEDGSTGYGYANSTGLLVILDVPEEFSEPEVRFQVHAAWLACSNVCIKAEADAALELSVASQAGPTPELMGSNYARRVPTPFSAVSGGAFEWITPNETGARAVMFRMPSGTLVDFYAARQPAVGEKVPTARLTDSGLLVQYQRQADLEHGGTLDGVLAAKTANGEQFFFVSVPVPGD